MKVLPSAGFAWRSPAQLAGMIDVAAKNFLRFMAAAVGAVLLISTSIG